jgi:hypothetical protein
MDVTLRPGRSEDANARGAICYKAFKAIASQHNFPPDFPSQEVAVELLSMLLSHPGFYAVVAEADGRIVGSNFLDERSTIAGAWTDHRRALCTEQWDRSAINGGALGSSGAAPLSRCAAGANGLPQSLALVVCQAWLYHPRALGRDAGAADLGDHPGLHRPSGHRGRSDGVQSGMYPCPRPRPQRRVTRCDPTGHCHRR